MRRHSDNKQLTLKREPLEGSGELLTVLKKTDWNKAKAARILGLDRSTLYRKVKKI